ncbi:cell wall anchor protein [Nocardiopsis exhalans]|uniref:Cell wall anchor protein n=1 Tax=Nocardiopsis exhalans TaxID=163604 RepID=A0ABY5DEI8_9ACTN|nr:cell wall anchor protein [Nocardiopsis exhalans]USY22432.1 cell wall anchor protein [Nocardiopsis exhalans]
MTTAQLWTLVALGAFHGLHPGMGWLLAVSRGLQEGGRRQVLRALPAIAVGHAVSVAVAAVAITVTGSATASVLFPVLGGGVIVLVGLVMLLSRRHFHWREVRLPLWQLTAWSFLMSSAHGAGLMLMPVLAGQLHHTHVDGGGHGGHTGGSQGAAAETVAAAEGSAAVGPGAGDAGSGEAADGTGGAVEAGEVTWSLWDATVLGLAATGVHTLAMLAAAGVAALIAYDFLGVHALRWKGVTMDRIWALTLVLGGVFVLWSVLWPAL